MANADGKSNLLEYEVVEPKGDAGACVIWLHGLGADGHDFVPIVPHLHLPDDLQVRFLFPHAPRIPVTCNGGFVMPAWYDILALTEIREINLQHLKQAQKAVGALIQQQIDNGIDAARIGMIGFSQGGAVAYHTALEFQQPLAGLIALSTYLPNPETLDPNKRKQNQSTPIHIAHGTRDDMVTTRASKLALEWLQQNHYNVDWSSYEMGHEVNIQEIRQIGRWIKEWLS